MATEYYLVKPKTKEMYCLGKRLNDFGYIRNATYRSEKTIEEHANYHEYEYFNHFVLDVIELNSYFMESVEDETWGTINELFHEIWEFIQGDKVILVSDVCDEFDFDSYKEVGSIYDFFDRVHKGE